MAVNFVHPLSDRFVVYWMDLVALVAALEGFLLLSFVVFQVDLDNAFVDFAVASEVVLVVEFFVDELAEIFVVSLVAPVQLLDFVEFEADVFVSTADLVLPVDVSDIDLDAAHLASAAALDAIVLMAFVDTGDDPRPPFEFSGIPG